MTLRSMVYKSRETERKTGKPVKECLCPSIHTRSIYTGQTTGKQKASGPLYRMDRGLELYIIQDGIISNYSCCDNFA